MNKEILKLDTITTNDWVKKVKVFDALGDIERQKILLCFEKGESLSIKEIVDNSNLQRSSIVFHLKKLEEAGILISKKEGKFVFYNVDVSPIKLAFSEVSNIYERNLQ